MSFGFSPSDIKEFLGIVNWLYDSLRNEGGSREDFQSLHLVQERLQQTLENASENVTILSIDDAERDAFLKTVNVIETRAKSLAARHTKLDKKFSSKNAASWYRQVMPKLKWMLDKSEDRLLHKDVVEQSNMLSNQLNISGLKTIVRKVEDAVSTTEKMHNAQNVRAQSDKLELKDVIQTCSRIQNETTLTTSATLVQKLDGLEANHLRLRGKLESDLSSLHKVVDGNSDVRTISRLEYFHTDLHQDMQAAEYHASNQTRMISSINDEIADLNLRISQSMTQTSVREGDSSSPYMPGGLPGIIAAVAILAVSRHPQGYAMILKASEMGVKDQVTCLLAAYIFYALYQVLRSSVPPRLTHRMSNGAECVFFQDPWSKKVKIPFSIAQHPKILDAFASVYLDERIPFEDPEYTNPDPLPFYWFTGPSGSSLVKRRDWRRRVRPGMVLSLAVATPALRFPWECPHCGYIFEEPENNDYRLHQPDCGKLPKPDPCRREEARKMVPYLNFDYDQAGLIFRAFLADPISVWDSMEDVPLSASTSLICEPA